MAFKSTKETGLWGLDRIDQILLPLDGVFKFNRDGGTVDVCIVDSGILRNHIEFGSVNSAGRVQTLYDFRSELPLSDPGYISPSSNLYGIDDNGHGTFMASIVGGFTTGVSSGVRLYSVKVYNQILETTEERLFNGLNAVLQFHINKSNSRPTICLLPFSNPPVVTNQIENIIKNLYNQGIVLITTAGNFNRNISDSFPANLYETISVGGINQNDIFQNPTNTNDSSYSRISLSGNQASNFGDLDILAPAFRIKGAWINENIQDIFEFSNFQPSSYILFSSNSIAASFVAGVAALYLDTNPSANTEQVRSFLINSAVNNVIKNIPKGTNNRLLRSVFNPHVFIWNTTSGQIISTEEGTFIEERISAFGRDATGQSVPVEYFLSSGQLPPGLTLERSTGKIFGIVGLIDESTVGYVPVDSLSVSAQSTFLPNQKGYVDYIFNILVKNPFSTDVRTFYIRVVDVNVVPKWLPNTPTNLNDLFPANTFFYKNVIDFNLQDIPYVFDADNDTIQFAILNGELPPGLNLSANGVIKGTVGAIYPPTLTYPVSAGLINQEFLFTLRATDGDKSVDRYLSLTVFRDGTNNSPPVFEQPAWNVTAVGQFFEGGLINIIFTTQDSDDDRVQYFRVQPFTNNEIPPETIVVEYTDVIQPEYDSSDLEFVTSDWPWGNTNFVSAEFPASSKVYHRTPVFVNINTSGRLQGVLTVLNNVGNYYFTIDAFDGWDITRETFLLKVDPLNIEIITALASLAWITPQGSLGDIDETYPSYFRVEAQFPPDQNLIYTVVSGSNSQLPPGININQQTGEFIGYFSPVSATTTYTFIIRATLVDIGNTSLDGEFSITVNKIWDTPISEFSFNLSGNQKLLWYSLVSEDIDGGNTQTLLPRSSWYRPNDPIYGENWEPKIYIMGGTPKLTDQEIFDLLNLETNVNATGYESYANYWGKLQVIFGDINAAVARDHNGDIIYEVIYYEIFDTQQNNKGISDEGAVDPIANPDTNSPVQFFYPTSLNNWRRDLLGDAGLQNDVERLPLWMKSPQVSANASDMLGFTPSIELLYVRPGVSQNLLNTLRLIQTKLIKRGEVIDIDRITYTDLSDPNNPRSKQIKFPPGDILR